MKTPRILCSLFVLGTFTGNALAVMEQQKCYDTNKTGIDYTVYFENDRPRQKEDAGKTYRQLNQTSKANCVDDLERTLGGLRASDQDNCIILLASADKANDNVRQYNTELSIRRASLVYNMLTDAIKNDDCIRAFAAGASNSYLDDDNRWYIHDSEERVVRIIITQKNITPPPEIEEITINVTNNFNNTQNTVINTTNITIDNSQALANQKRIDIVSIAGDLKNMNSEFERTRSHWKTASGNFNGARLASDSIAGVVLGTAGGLITSKVIKKNQLKNGFEDLHCAIGGQVVADYNDEFTTGIDLH